MLPPQVPETCASAIPPHPHIFLMSKLLFDWTKFYIFVETYVFSNQNFLFLLASKNFDILFYNIFCNLSIKISKKFNLNLQISLPKFARKLSRKHKFLKNMPFLLFYLTFLAKFLYNLAWKVFFKFFVGFLFYRSLLLDSIYRILLLDFY